MRKFENRPRWVFFLLLLFGACLFLPKDASAYGMTPSGHTSSGAEKYTVTDDSGKTIGIVDSNGNYVGEAGNPDVKAAADAAKAAKAAADKAAKDAADKAAAEKAAKEAAEKAAKEAADKAAKEAADKAAAEQAAADEAAREAKLQNAADEAEAERKARKKKIEEQADHLISRDPGNYPPNERERLIQFIEEGGVIEGPTPQPPPIRSPLTPEEQANKDSMENQALWDAYFGGFVEGLKQKAAGAAEKAATAKDPAEKAAAKAAAEKAQRAAKGDRSAMSREDRERLEGLEEAYQKRWEQLQKEKAKKEAPLSMGPTISQEVAVALPDTRYAESEDVRRLDRHWMNMPGGTTDLTEAGRALQVQVGQDILVRSKESSQSTQTNDGQTTPLCGPAPVLAKSTPQFNFSAKPRAARHSGNWQWWKK